MLNKKILITGAAGFIGSHLAEYFIKKGYKVVAFDRYNSNNSFGWLDKSPYKKKIECVLGDIRDYDSVFKTMKNCDSVIHLAALIGIPYSYISPLAYIRTNVDGTYNILEASRNLKIKNIVITSTSETYGSAQYMPIDEYHPIVSQSPYAASKAAADQLALSFYRSYNLPVKIIRPFNTYGPRQSSRAIIPSIINQCLYNKNRNIFLGNIKPTRDLTYVEDLCEAFLKVFKNKKLFGEVVNVGNNSNISIKDLVNKISKLINVKVKIKSEKLRVRPKYSEVSDLKSSIKKITMFTKWKPKTKIDRGLKKTIDWIKLNKNYYKNNYSL